MEPDVNDSFTPDLATPIFKLSDSAKNDELSFEGKDNEALAKPMNVAKW